MAWTCGEPLSGALPAAHIMLCGLAVALLPLPALPLRGCTGRTAGVGLGIGDQSALHVESLGVFTAVRLENSSEVSLALPWVTHPVQRSLKLGLHHLLCRNRGGCGWAGPPTAQLRGTARTAECVKGAPGLWVMSRACPTLCYRPSLSLSFSRPTR